MLALDYDLSPSWKRQWAERDLRHASESELRYECFLGDVTFVADGVDFSARWGWVPVLDFAVGLRSLASELVELREASFEFTESDAAVHCERTDHDVTIDANYAPGRAHLRFTELQVETRRFELRVIAELAADNPTLAQNAFITTRLRESVRQR
jgi:hypothetical protein